MGGWEAISNCVFYACVAWVTIAYFEKEKPSAERCSACKKALAETSHYC
jgi:hypothetical protein